MNQHYAATGGIPEELLILPPGAIQSCHLIRSGLDCQIPLSEAAWRIQSEKQAVRCGLPVIQAKRTEKNPLPVVYLISIVNRSVQDKAIFDQLTLAYGGTQVPPFQDDGFSGSLRCPSCEGHRSLLKGLMVDEYRAG